jgi:hypothetical protein
MKHGCVTDPTNPGIVDGSTGTVISNSTAPVVSDRLYPLARTDEDPRFTVGLQKEIPMVRAMLIEVKLENGHVLNVRRNEDESLHLFANDRGVIPLLSMNDAEELSRALHLMCVGFRATTPSGQKKDPQP